MVLFMVEDGFFEVSRDVQENLLYEIFNVDSPLFVKAMLSLSLTSKNEGWKYIPFLPYVREIQFMWTSICVELKYALKKLEFSVARKNIQLAK